MEIVSGHVHREFGFCKILWKIEHFCLVACNDNWTISSPVFSVRAPCLTTWTIILNSEPVQDENTTEDCLISVSLKRSESDPGPDTVLADWKIVILNGKRSEFKYYSTKGYFRKNTFCKEGLQLLNDVLKEFQPFETDVLCLQCQLIVSFDNFDEKINECSDQGIITLSDDLTALYSSRNGYDLTLKIKDNHFFLHKAILYARNPTFAKILDSNLDVEVIDLFPPQPPDTLDVDLFFNPFVNSADMEKVFQYLYSGNLKFVIGEPSVSIYECALIFDVNEIIQYYIPDELTLQSGVDAEEMVFIWIVTDFESINQACVLSPPLTEMASETIWRLRLLPKGEGDCGEYVSIFAEVIEGTRLQSVCLEFATTNSLHEFSNYRRMHQKSVGLGGTLGFADFINRDSLKDTPFLENGTLRVIFKLRVFGADGNPTSSYECDSVSMVTAKTGTLEFLSEDMSCLLEEGKFSDAAVRCEDKVFHLHRCILSARSDSLSKILCERLKNNKEIHFPDVKLEIFNVLLSYIYSGRVVDIDCNVASEIFKSALNFNMYGLMNKSLQFFNGTGPS